MEMKESKQGEVLVIQLMGELMGGDDAKSFQDRIYQAIEEGSVNVIVDMGDVKWMNSSGLGLLMAGLTTLRSSDGDLKLIHASERVRRPIEVTKLDKVLLIYNTLEEAARSFDEEA